MKNIHLIPTEKPSRLGYLTKKGKEVFKDLRLFNKPMPNILDSENQHIYITSDEPIKIDDYYLGDDNHIYCLVTTVNSNGKKIILTTDQDLIKDGIQSIDDTFLEWFVKNPSCDFVEVEKKSYIEIKEISYEGDFQNVEYINYKIIIPKEEPKQDLEKAIFNLEEELDIPSHLRLHNSKTEQERMYSEEEVDKLLDTLLHNNMCSVAGDELIKQFKKK
jgi:hypothetical protein